MECGILLNKYRFDCCARVLDIHTDNVLDFIIFFCYLISTYIFFNLKRVIFRCTNTSFNTQVGTYIC